MHENQADSNMELTEERMLVASLHKVEKVARVGYRIFQVLFILFLLGVLALAGLKIFTSLSLGDQPMNVPGLIWSITGLAVVSMPTAAILLTVSTILLDVSKGKSLFHTGQVKRIRLIALAFIIEAVLRTLFSPGFASMVNIDGWFSAGIVLGQETGTTDIPLNVSNLFFALILYCLSVAFEHAELLQKLTDDTV